MGLTSVKALILRANPANDHDRYVRIICREFGLIKTYARGALRPKNALLASTEAFGFCELTLFTHKEKYYINNATFIYPFSALKQSIECLTAAAHLADIAIDISQSVEAYEALYELLVYAFYALEQAATADVHAVLSVVHACEIRLLALAGYRLNFEACPHCGLALNDIRALYFNFPSMRFICGNEAKKSLGLNVAKQSHTEGSKSWEIPYHSYLGEPLWPISQALFEALRFFSEQAQSRLFSFKISPELERELAAFTQAYLTASLEKNYKRLGFLFQLMGN